MGQFLSSRLIGDILQGLTSGVLYALVALSLVLIWRSTHILNFAQGAIAMFAAYVGLTETDHSVPLGWCFLIAIAAGTVAGAITERTLIRPLYGKPEINPIVVMVGLLGLLEAVARAIWTTVPRSVNAPFSQNYYLYHGRTIYMSPFLFFELIVVVGVMLSIAALFRFTKLGLQLRAAATAPEVARLLGVRVGRLLTFGWMLAAAIGALAATIYATQFATYTPYFMDPLFVFGFVAAAIGGLESPSGAVAGGLMVGISSQLINDYWSNSASELVPLALLLLVLMLRPRGLFTRHAERRV